jgi:hypothetical protein
MADRVLTWYVETPLEAGASVRETYELDADYVPKRIWLHVETAPIGANIVVDVNYDFEGSASSIFTTPNPGIQVGSRFGERDYFVNPRILKRNALITLDIDQIGSGEGGKSLTVQLELEKT